jgi:hypothetical protein
MKELGIAEGSTKYETLRKNRTNITRFVEKILNIVVHSFDLLDTPDKQEEAKKKKNNKVTPYKTPEEVRTQAQESLNKVAEERKTDEISILIPEEVISVQNPITQAVDVEDETLHGIEPNRNNNLNPNQLYETPDSALDLLWVFIQDELTKPDVEIYDSCCGLNRHIVNYFRNKPIQRVHGTDLHYGEEEERKDFLKMRKDDIEVISTTYFITNPPFKGVSYFIKHLEKLQKPYAILLPVYALNYEMVRQYIASNPSSYSILFVGSHGFKVPYQNEPQTIRFGQVWLIKAIKILEDFTHTASPCFFIPKANTYHLTHLEEGEEEYNEDNVNGFIDNIEN